MGRSLGTFKYSANYEVAKKAPLDARQLVDSYSDLLLESTWCDSDGGVWLYDGAIVVVSNDIDTSKNGVYWLCDASNYTSEDSWINVGYDSDFIIENGLSLINAGTTIRLGGNLVTGTTINGLGLHGFHFDCIENFRINSSNQYESTFNIDNNGICLSHSGLSLSLSCNFGLKYDDCYHDVFEIHSIPDVSYVTGITSNIYSCFNNYYTKTEINNYSGNTDGRISFLEDNIITGVTCVGSGVIPYVDVHEKEIIFNTIKGSGGTKVSKVGYDIIIHSTTGSSSGGDSVFDYDIEVSICEGKTFGKYLNGDVIPSSGKTAIDVIKMALNEEKKPTVTLTSSGDDVRFGLVDKEINLCFDYVINTLDADVDCVCLEWYGGDILGWTVLTESVDCKTFKHYINDRFNACTNCFRYTVYDTAGASETVSYSVTPQQYTAPNINISLNGDITSPETQNSRERGNVISCPSGYVCSNRELVNIVGWCLQRCYSGDSWKTISSGTSLNEQCINIPSVEDNTISNNATCISYRICYEDEYTNGCGGNQSIGFKDYSYWGFNNTYPLNSSQIQTLGNKCFMPDVSLNWNNINTPANNYTYYVYPSNYSDITSIIKNGVEQDLGAWSGLTNFSVTNLHGVSVNYKVYKTNARQAYGLSDCIKIT